MIENNPTNVEAAFEMLLPRLISSMVDVSELDIAVPEEDNKA